MPPLAMMPYQPPGAPDITSYGYGGGMGPASSSGSSSFDEEYFRRMDAYIAQVQAAMAASAGWEREKFRRQLEDAVEARKQARELAQLQDQTQRYGIDVGSRDRKEALEQNMRQFEMNHALELQKFGLSRAQAATDYMSTPDRFIQAGDFINLSSRVFAGQPGAAPYGTVGTAQPKGESDFAVLAAGGNPGRQIDAEQVAAAGGSGADARTKALKALNDLPASVGSGLDENDYAVLRASAAIRGMSLTPQQQAAFNASPQSKAILGSSLRRLGDNPDEWWKSQRRSLPGQQSAGLA